MHKTKKDKLEEEIKKEESRELDELENEPVSEQEQTGAESELPGAEQLRDQLLRKAAEFENYKRRTESEISNFLKYANEETMSDLLPVLDDFERVMGSWNKEHDVETFKKGVELIYEKFKKILEKKGLKEVESTGKPFDVNLHDALMQVENNELKPNTVTETVEKGYYLKDKILRHAKVLVSKKGDKDTGDSAPEGNK
jgi:molecular chaperone GrpE